MSGGESCASTLPSLNSTKLWITDSGWMITSICWAGRPNSQRASITSSALFISVAESMVILRPMRQVGWRSACSTVTSARSARDRPRNGPPVPVRTTRSTDDGPGLPCSAWKMALCSLSTGTSLPPVRAASSVTRAPAMTRVSLLATATVLPRLQGGPRSFQPGRADNGGHHRIDAVVGYHARHAVRAAQEFAAVGQPGRVEIDGRIGQAHEARVESMRLLDQEINARVGGQSDDLKAVRQVGGHIERADADGARGPEHRNPGERAINCP